MKRRIVTLLLAALLLCTAAGCGEKNAADGTLSLIHISEPTRR